MPSVKATIKTALPEVPLDHIYYNDLVMLQKASVDCTPRRTRVRKRKNEIGRPMNSFILFRQWANDTLIKVYAPHVNHRLVSKCVAKWWKELGDEGRGHWQTKAKVTKEEHKRMYPLYKYRPAMKKSSKKRELDEEEDSDDDFNRRNKKSRQESTFSAHNMAPMYYYQQDASPYMEMYNNGAYMSSNQYLPAGYNMFAPLPTTGTMQLNAEDMLYPPQQNLDYANVEDNNISAGAAYSTPSLESSTSFSPQSVIEEAPIVDGASLFYSPQTQHQVYIDPQNLDSSYSNEQKSLVDPRQRSWSYAPGMTLPSEQASADNQKYEQTLSSEGIQQILSSYQSVW